MPVADFLHTGFLNAVGGNDAVAAEIVVTLTFPEVSAVPQNSLSLGILMPQRLVHIVPNKAALVQGEFINHFYIAFHTAQGVAHIVHIFAADVGFLGIQFQIFPDFRRGGIHAGFHVRNSLVFGTPVGAVGCTVHNTPGPVAAFVMHKAAGILGAEEVCHFHNVGTTEGFVAAGPEENGNVVFIPLEHGVCPIQHTVFPFRQTAGDVPFGINEHILLPGTVGLQIGFIHHVDTLAVAHKIPFAAVGIMAGADSVDVVALKNIHGSFHIRNSNAAAGGSVPFMPVHTVDDETFAVEGHDLVHHFKATEADVIGDISAVLHGQQYMVQFGSTVIPQTDVGEYQFLGEQKSIPFSQSQITCPDFAVCIVGDLAVNSGNSLTADSQTDSHPSCRQILVQRSIQPQVVHRNWHLCIQVHTAENTTEPEEVLVFQPGGTALLVYFHAEPVAGFLDIRSQIKVRGGKGVLTVTHKLTVEPHEECLFHTLEGNADPLVSECGIQIKFRHIAAHGIIRPVDVGRAQEGMAIPGIELVDILDLVIPLGFHMTGNMDGSKTGQVITVFPEVGRTQGRRFAPTEFPLTVQTLPKRGAVIVQFLRRSITDMVGMGIQPVDPEYGGVFQPFQIRDHSGILLKLGVDSSDNQSIQKYDKPF